ncbi:hypothetical protein DV738_g268, partial [Chaetothyriales sp. CBS 135597]
MSSAVASLMPPSAIDGITRSGLSTTHGLTRSLSPSSLPSQHQSSNHLFLGQSQPFLGDRSTPTVVVNEQFRTSLPGLASIAGLASAAPSDNRGRPMQNPLRPVPTPGIAGNTPADSLPNRSPLIGWMAQRQDCASGGSRRSAEVLIDYTIDLRFLVLSAILIMAASLAASTTDQLPFQQPVCQNCATSTTPLWRRDEAGSVLCNACGLFLKLHGRPRPISLKTDVIKSRNRVKSTNQTPKKKYENGLPASQSVDMSATARQNHRRVSQMAASVTSERSHSPVSRTNTPSLHHDPNIAPQHMFDGVTLGDGPAFPAGSPSLPPLNLGQPLAGGNLEGSISYDQLLAANTSLRTRVSELEVINMVYSDNENSLRSERDKAIRERDELQQRLEQLEKQLNGSTVTTTATATAAVPAEPDRPSKKAKLSSEDPELRPSPPIQRKILEEEIEEMSSSTPISHYLTSISLTPRALAKRTPLRYSDNSKIRALLAKPSWSTMLRDLHSQIRFVQQMRDGVDVDGVEPLVAIRDESEAAVGEARVGLADEEIRAALADE